MRVPLILDDELRLWIKTSITCVGRPRIPVRFLLDTGSRHSFIDEEITAAVRVFTKNLVFEDYILLGGTKIGLYKLRGMKMDVISVDGKEAAIPFDNMKISENARPGKSSVSMPISILGMNFLLETGAELYLNASKQIAYLDIEPAGIK